MLKHLRKFWDWFTCASPYTEWYSAEQFVPGQQGVFEVNLFNTRSFAFWNGLWWGCVEQQKSRAYRSRDVRSSLMDGQGISWRGLRKKP